MGGEELTGVVRRRLVVVAIGGYDDQPEGFDEAIADQVERITGWLADPALGTDRRFEVSRAPAVRTVAELRAFLRGEELAAAGYREAVVVYITGHGLRRTAPRHFLTLPETDQDRLFATAFPTSELITEVLDSESEHVMVMVDSCFSGTLRAELGLLLEALSSDRHDHRGTAVITAGNHQEQPLVGSFTDRVALACGRMRDEAAGYTASHLSFAEWEQLLDEVGRRPNGQEMDLVSAEWIVPHSRRRGLSACLPNPRYQPAEGAADPALSQLALTSAAVRGAGEDRERDPLAEFWVERASGRASADDPGWYFSGRAKPMVRMTGFLDGTGGALIVTGAAGSGKSALLARLVTLSDPDFVTDPRHEALVAAIPRELRPEPGSVDVAVLARNKSARVVVDELFTALGGEARTRTGSRESGRAGTGGEPPIQALIRLVGERADRAAGPVTVVIDALDEARDPLALVNDIIVPLARLRLREDGGAVRLLLGVRSSPAMSFATGPDLRDDRADQLLRRLTEALSAEGVTPGELRTDGPDCPGDIAAYAATLLTEPEDSPYRDDPAAATAAARIIAAEVAPSFLDARIAADQLRRAGERQDLTEDGWLDRLADGTTGLLREDIRAVSLSTGIPADLLVVALRATAFAPGTGLPWGEVWPTVAAVLATDAYGPGYVDRDTADQAIRALRSSRLTGYLATAEEDARTVYRPVHQRLTDLLVADHDWLLASPPVTGSRWWRPASRSRALTAAHRAITEALAGLVRRARPHAAHPYIRRHFLHHAAAGGVLTDRAVPVELLAQETSRGLRARLGLPLPLADPERRNLTAAAIVEPYLDDSVDVASRRSSVVFHAGEDGASAEGPDRPPLTPVWSRWAAPANVLAPPRPRTNSLCALPTMDGRSLIAEATARGDGVRIWDAATGELTAELDAGGPPDALVPIRATGGRTFLVALHVSGARIYDPTSGQLIAAVALADAVEVQVLEDGPALWKLLIRAREDAFLWRPRRRPTGREELVRASGFPAVAPGFRKTAVVRRASGHALVAVATAEGVRLWDPVRGLIGQPPFGGAGVRLPATVPRPEEDDLLLLRNGPTAERLEVWDPFTGVRVARVPRGGRRAVALPGGRRLARTLGSRIIVRDLGSGEERSFDADVPAVETLAAWQDGPSARLVSAGPQGIRLWEPDAGSGPDGDGPEAARYRAPAGATWRHSGWPLCRVPQQAPGMDVLVLGRPSGLDLHDAATGERLGQVDTPSVIAVQPLVSPGDVPRLAVIQWDQWSIWELRPERPVMTFSARRLGNAPSCVAWTPAGLPMLVVAEDLLTLRLVRWDPDGGDVMVSTVAPGGRVGQPHALVALPPRSHGDRTVVAATGRDRSVVLLDVTSGDRVGTLPLPPRSGLPRHPLAFTAHGRVLFAASTRDAIHVWDAVAGTPLATWAAPEPLALTTLDLPDGRTLLASGDSGGVRLWDVWTGELRHTLLTGAPVRALVATSTPTGADLHLHGPAGLAMVALDQRLL
ncbi:AAA family ATPase [Streptomyces sp. NPDC057638]|uniref:AAA family ATPase n=1 Tax=Streptomyces sp. NPDC057638 TaxID=3346190 RepID=UPI00368C114E